MAGMFDLFESGLLRGNRTGGAAFDIPTGDGPPRIDDEVRKRLAAMRAGGAAPAAAPPAAPPAAATTAVGTAEGATAAKGLGARMLGWLNPVLTGATMMTASSPAGTGSDVVIDQTTGKPFPRGIPLDPELVKRTGIPTTGAQLTPDQIASINMTGRSGVGARPVASPVTPDELAMGERNYQTAMAGAASTPAAGGAAALDPRIKTDAQGNIVRSGPTLDANGNVVIDTARVGQVAAEERAIMERAFPKRIAAVGGARVAAATPADGMPQWSGQWQDIPAFLKQLGDYGATVGAQRTAARTSREVAKEVAKVQAEAGAKPFQVEGLTGKATVVGGVAYTLGADGKLVATRVPTPAAQLRPGLDPAMVRKEAEAAVKAGRDPKAINQALKDNGYAFQVK